MLIMSGLSLSFNLNIQFLISSENLIIFLLFPQLLTSSCSGFNIQSAALHPHGWTGSENKSICCCESHKPGQTVPANIQIFP